MAVFVSKLKSVLRPMSIAGRQADCDSVSSSASRIGLWMIRSVIHIDTRELSSWPISAKFSRCRLQHSVDVGDARYSKPSGLHPDINLLELRSLAPVCCTHHPELE
jgi:hypothetical protein